MTAHPFQNPHPERGPLWVHYERYGDDDHYPHGLMDDGEMLDTCSPKRAAIYATQLGQDLPEGFTLAPVATGAALSQADPLGAEWERWDHYDEEWKREHVTWVTHSDTYMVRRITKPAKVRVKAVDAYGRTIDGHRVTEVTIRPANPNGAVWTYGPSWFDADADGMVEVDPLDGDR